MDLYNLEAKQLCVALYKNKVNDCSWIYSWLEAVETNSELLHNSDGGFASIELPGVNWDDPYEYYCQHDCTVFDTLFSQGITKDRITFYITYLKSLSDYYRFTYSQFENLFHHFLNTHYIKIWILDHGGISGLLTYDFYKGQTEQLPVFDTKLIVGSLIGTAILAWWLTKQH